MPYARLQEVNPNFRTPKPVTNSQSEKNIITGSILSLEIHKHDENCSSATGALGDVSALAICCVIQEPGTFANT